MAADLSGDFGQLMELCGKYTVLKVRTNADTPKDAAGFRLRRRPASASAARNTCSLKATASRPSAK